MPANITTLITSLLGGSVCIALGVLIFVNGPRRFVKGVRWERVSDEPAFGRFAARILLALGVTHIGFGIAQYVLSANVALSKGLSLAFGSIVACLILVLALRAYRAQNKPATPRDGR